MSDQHVLNITMTDFMIHIQTIMYSIDLQVTRILDL